MLITFRGKTVFHNTGASAPSIGIFNKHCTALRRIPFRKLEIFHFLLLTLAPFVVACCRGVVYMLGSLATPSFVSYMHINLKGTISKPRAYGLSSGQRCVHTKEKPFNVSDCIETNIMRNNLQSTQTAAPVIKSTTRTQIKFRLSCEYVWSAHSRSESAEE